jgi:hypothetical protein
MTNNSAGINLDLPLNTSNALQDDKLSRKGFAEAAAMALRKVPSSAGLVVSVEGAWGSGKTSTLAMIEAILMQSTNQPPPVIVHFNPWLVGEKDALLRHFLSRIAGAIKLSDPSRDGKKAAKEIKAYAKAFDLLKLIPGAEPWASMIKSVVEAVGDSAGDVAEYKTPDIEAYKLKVEKALSQFERPIIVFIDDIDRLFPLEVFEMVRIIKAVGGLPNVGYVLAWDSAYVSSALEKLHVPYASSYLDKIVQVRMPLPSLSLSARRQLIDKALDELDPEVLRPRFNGQDQRLSHLYLSGLRDFLEQPRDIARVFNAVRMMEPLLRGEIVFADILGLAALSVKAPTVFDLLRKNPRLFVGRIGEDYELLEKSKDVVKGGEEERKVAYDASSSPRGVQRVIHFLFPLVAEAEGRYALTQGSYVEGNIAHPVKLAIALQLSMADSDVSIKAARRYLQQPEQRLEVIASLTQENCNEFLELLGEMAQSLRGEGISDIEELCLAIAKLPEQPLFVKRSNGHRKALSFGAEDVALHTICMLVYATDESRMNAIAERISLNPDALSCASQIVSQSYLPGREQRFQQITASAEAKTEILRTFASNVLKASESGRLFEMKNPGFTLWTMAWAVPSACPEIYKALKAKDHTLDKFVLQFLGGRWDSTKGASYSLPRDVTLHSVYCPVDEFKLHAAARLADQSLDYPAKAAWRSVIEGKSFYGVDGTEAD